MTMMEFGNMLQKCASWLVYERQKPLARNLTHSNYTAPDGAFGFQIRVRNWGPCSGSHIFGRNFYYQYCQLCAGVSWLHLVSDLSNVSCFLLWNLSIRDTCENLLTHSDSFISLKIQENWRHKGKVLANYEKSWWINTFLVFLTSKFTRFRK